MQQKTSKQTKSKKAKPEQKTQETGDFFWYNSLQDEQEVKELFNTNSKTYRHTDDGYWFIN